MNSGVGRDEIILDSGPSIALDQLGYVEVLLNEDDLLLSLPEQVAHELAVKPDLAGGRLPESLHVVPIQGADIEKLQRQIVRPLLGAGEVGVILAAERQWAATQGKPACAVIDDRDAWEVARARWGGVDRLCGTLSLLYLVHERQLEQRPLREDVDFLTRSAHRLSEAEASRYLRFAEPLLQRGRVGGAKRPAGEAWLRRVREAGMQRRARSRPMPSRDGRSSTVINDRVASARRRCPQCTSSGRDSQSIEWYSNCGQDYLAYSPDELTEEVNSQRRAMPVPRMPAFGAGTAPATLRMPALGPARRRLQRNPR